jgi:hypothetical protein
MEIKTKKLNIKQATNDGVKIDTILEALKLLKLDDKDKFKIFIEGFDDFDKSEILNICEIQNQYKHTKVDLGDYK